MSRRNYYKHDPAPLSLYNRSTTTSRYILTTKLQSEKTKKNDGQTGLPCLDKPVLAQGGGGGRGVDGSVHLP